MISTSLLMGSTLFFNQFNYTFFQLIPYRYNQRLEIRKNETRKIFYNS